MQRSEIVVLPLLASLLSPACGGPATPQAAEQPHGALSKDAIRDVIRPRLNEVRVCYEQGLARRPTLAGRVDVRFVVAPSGAVQDSMLFRSSLGDPTVEACIVQTVRRWPFPPPEGGGTVVITYPFILQPSP